MAKIAMTSDKKIMVINESVEGIPSITIDSELSDTSTNPVQNKVIKAAIDAVDTKVGNKQDKIGVSGLLKCDGTTISAAVAGTDYVVPSTALEEVPGHIANKSNPHGVTAEQAGAYTKEETNTLLQNKADLGEDGKVLTSQLPEMDYLPISGGAITSEQPVTMAVRNTALSATEQIPTVNGEICWQYA